MNTTGQEPRCSGGRRICAWLVVVLLTSEATAQTINWGPFRLNLGVTAGVTYTDNTNTSETNPQSEWEFSIGPTVSGSIILAPTLPGGEQLAITTSASYSFKYSLEKGEDETFSAPVNVSLVLPVYIARWDVVLSDTFSFSNEPLEQTFAFNRDEVPNYNNNASLSVGRNFGRVGVNFTASRGDKIYPDDPEQEETNYQFSFTPSYFFRENYSVFLRNSIGYTIRHGPGEPDSWGYSIELGVAGQITQNLSGFVSLGYAHTTIFDRFEEGDPSDPFGGVFNRRRLPDDRVDGISSTIGLNYSHPLRPNTTYSISFSRSPGITAALEDSDITEATSATLSIAHRLTRLITLAPSISWVYLKDISSSGGGEKVHIWNVSLGLSRPITRKLQSSFSYRFQTRDSNLAGQSYDVNTVSLQFNYTF